MPRRPHLAAPLLLALLAACSAERPLPAPSPAEAAILAPVEATAAPATASCAALAAAAAPPENEDFAWEDQRNARDKPDDSKDTCGVADSNLGRVEEAILGAAGRGAPATATPWDHRGKPARLDLVARRFGLRPSEHALLEKNGFVVPARLAFSSYAEAFHEIYQSEMPLYVSADAVLHAVFQGNDRVAVRLEKRRLAPLLGRVLAAMSCALPAAAAAYPPETARDLDVYLTVARTLLADHDERPAFDEDAAPAGALAEKARAAAAMDTVDLFGRERRIDFTAFTPRGHYAKAEDGLTPYFRAAMWLSRVELNLVSRSCRSSAATDVADPRETPREAVDALALADLAARAEAVDDIGALDRAWATLAGKREDASIADLAAIRAKAGIGALREPDVFQRFKAAVGEGFQRTTRLHYMPEGTTVLPAIATLLGPRVVADSTATQPLVAPETPDRHVIGAAEMGYALGHDRARAYLGGEIARFPALGARLDEARALAHAPHAAHNGEDLYGLWLRGVLALAERPAGALPSFMGTDAFADLRLDSAIAAFGQIRHNAVLYAGQGYDQGGCEIPDGYVEPAPAVYDALVAYADRGAAAAVAIDPKDSARAGLYFAALGRVLRVLATISRDELAGRALSDDERAFLSMVLEMTPGSSGGGPTYTGWYFDMFPSRNDALARADFIADYFTSGYDEVISYAGATAPRLGFFVVDTGGAPRVVVGPVARAYEHHGPLGKRLDDEAARAIARPSAPWEASYAVAPPREPDLEASFGEERGAARFLTVTVEAPRAVGPVTVALLDHHRGTIEAITRSVPAGKTKLRFKLPDEKRPIEGLSVQAGEARAFVEATWAGASVVLGKGVGN